MLLGSQIVTVSRGRNLVGSKLGITFINIKQRFVYTSVGL